MKNLVTALSCAALATTSLAGPVSYAGKTQQIRAGVLILDSQISSGVPANLRPHVWGQLDRDRAIKPAAWNFVNPLATTVLTDSVRSRWLALGPGLLPDTGANLSKDHAGYWEVFLSNVGMDQMNRFDALFLSVSGTVRLRPTDREKLRRYVDQGGMLWVDVQPTVGAAAIDPLNPLPVPFTLVGGGGTLFAAFDHPVLNSPNRLGVNELSSVFSGRTGSVAPLPDQGEIQSWIGIDSIRWQPVLGEDANSLTIGLARIGDGMMMITTRGVSDWLNAGLNGVQFNTNTGFTSLPPYAGPQYNTVAKLAVNALNLRASYNTSAAGVRHSGSIRPEISAPLFRSFAASTSPGGNSGSVYKGRIVLTEGNRVVVLDAEPNFDRDLDGNPDDGFPDPLGSQVDVLWASEALPGDLSSATCTESIRADVNDPVRDKVLVTAQTGGVFQFDLDPTGFALDQVPAERTYTPPSTPDGNSIAVAPVVHENLVYVADTFNNRTRIWTIDFSAQAVMQSNARWVLSRINTCGPVAGPPAVGYIPIRDSSGGVDRVMYVPFNADGAKRSGLGSIWIGARGEAPSRVQVSGTILTVTTRAGINNNLPIYLGTENPSLGVKVSLIDANGIPYPASTVNSWITSVAAGPSNGSLNFTLTAAGAAQDWSDSGNVSMRIDYTIDWGFGSLGANNADIFVRGFIEFPDDAVNGTAIQGGVAMGPNGNLFVVTAPPNIDANGGSLWALQEFGRGSFRVLYRWECYDQFQFPVGSATNSVTYDPAIIDYDGLLDLRFGTGSATLGQVFLDRRMSDLRIMGGATVSGDTVYIPVAGRKVIGFPLGGIPRFVSAVVALKADPEPLQVDIEGLTSGAFSIVQPDLTRSANKATPNSIINLQQGNFTVERNGDVTTLRLLSSAANSNGQLFNTLAANLPFVIRVPNASDIVVEPELQAGGVITKPGQTTNYVPGNARGRWNPERWVMVLNGTNLTSRVFKAGDILFAGGGSYLPQLLNLTGGGPPNFTRQDGLLYAVNTRIGANDLRTPTFVRNHMSNQSVARTWQRYVSTIDQGLNTITPSPYVLMPNPFGIRSFDDLRVRVRQATLETERVNGIFGGEGKVVAWGDGGIGNRTYVLARGDFAVADEGRIVRIDSVGNPVWTSDSTFAAGPSVPVGVTSNVVDIAKPTRTYAVGETGQIVVDPGNNRIAEIDVAGREVRSISRVKLDPNFIPADASATMPLSLSAPSDVYRYTSFVSQANNPFTNARPDEYWVRYLIADTGNGRIIELVDRYDYNRNRRVIGGPVTYVDPSSTRPGGQELALGVLNWHIQASVAKRRYAFNSIGQAMYTDGSGNARAIFAFGFGNREPSRATFGLDGPTGPVEENAGGSGGVVLYDPQRGATRVIDRFTLPAIPANAFWDNATGTFNSAARAAEPDRSIKGLKSVALSFVDSGSGPVLSVMITDNTGVYELVDPDEDGNFAASWFLPTEAYLVMRRAVISGNLTPTAKNPAGFVPTYARRMPSGEVMVVNGYVGRHRFALPVVSAFGINAGDPFGGEVLLLNGSFNADPAVTGFDLSKPNLGFNSFSVNFEIPPIQGIRGLVSPTFAEIR